MRSKLRFHKQETPDSCVPACLRMVLMAIGLEVSEAEFVNLRPKQNRAMEILDPLIREQVKAVIYRLLGGI